MYCFFLSCKMNRTKRKILDAGRELFNTHGIANVSQRRISEHLGISPGNLTYHFKKSDDIIEALYYELVSSIDVAMAEIKSMNYGLPFMFRLIKILVDVFYEYRFIFLDFVHIMRNHERLRKHYEQLSVLRRQQFLEAIQFLIDSGTLRNEELPREYEFLYERFQILADFWISSVEVKEKGIEKHHLETFKKVLIQSTYSYLTKQGKKTFLAIYDAL